MSKQKRGMFRLMAAAVMGAFGMGGTVTRHYPDPKVRDRYDSPELRRPARGRYRRRNDVRPLIKRGNLGYPRPAIGNIGYHDKLVRKFGRRMAEEYREILLDRDMSAAQRLAFLPTPELMANTRDWAWRKA